MSPYRLTWLAAGLLLAFAAPTLAQAEPRVVSLSEVLERARDNPPAVLAAVATLEKNRAQEDVARGAYLPRVSASVTGGIQYDNRPVLPTVRFDSTSLTSTAQVTAEWTAFDMSRRPAVEGAHASANAQAYAVAASRRTAMQAAAELYFRALAASALVEDAALTVERRTKQLDAIRALVKGGIRPAVDEARATIDAVAAESALDIRKVEQRALEAALAGAIGGDPTEPVRPQATSELPDPPSSVEAAINLALEQRPELAQLVETLEARRADDRTARGQRWPTGGVSVSGQGAYNDMLSGAGISGTTYGGTAALFLRWTALDPGVWRRARVTSAAIDEAERQLEVAVLNVRTEVADAAYAVERTHAALEQATKVLEAAQVARVAQNERYQRGIASILELLDAEAVEQSARLRRIEAERDQRVANARLFAVCGTLGSTGGASKSVAPQVVVEFARPRSR